MNKKIVLVVDDNAVILKTISLALQKQNFDVVTALDGSEAVGAVRREKPNVIVLDLSFPPSFGNVEWDGFRIMQWLKRIEEAKNVPFIIITGGDAAKYKDRALKEGAAAFFQKPVNNDQLVATIRQLLGITQAETPSPAPVTA
ncbi:MAG: response regulator [Verrucomicrobiota bacterium]